jgi:hypothetical protein
VYPELVLQKVLLDFAAGEAVDQDSAVVAAEAAAVEQSLAAVEVQEQTGPLHAFESVAVQSAEEDVVGQESVQTDP